MSRAMTTRADRMTPHATAGARAAVDARPPVPAGQLRAFIDAFDRLGYNVASLLGTAGLRRTDLDDQDALFPCEAMGTVVATAMRERRVPNLGAHLASVTPLGAHQLLDYLIVTAETVGAALDQLVRYLHLANAPIVLSIVRDEAAVRVLVQPGDDDFIAQYETSLIVHHLRTETEQRMRFTGASLMKEPDDRHDLEQLWQCPLTAPTTWSGVEFRNDMLALPMRRRESALRRVLETYAMTVSTKGSSNAPEPTGDRVSSALMAGLRNGVPALHEVARQLAMAPRTLQRRLAAEGRSYAELVDAVRKGAAERLLESAHLSVNDISYLLGYSEPSAFQRAFKRWHGVPAQTYRVSRHSC